MFKQLNNLTAKKMKVNGKFNKLVIETLVKEINKNNDHYHLMMFPKTITNYHLPLPSLN